MRAIAPLSRGLALSFALAAWPAAAQSPIGTAFTYQGRLSDGGNPASGSFDFQLLLFDAAIAGSQVGATLDQQAVSVGGGLFTMTLDFGPAAIGGSARWLEIRVRPAGGGAYTILSGRQRLTPTPGALFSASAPWTGLQAVPPGFADGVDNDSGGDVTSVVAGGGLVGGGTTGDLTMAVAFGGNGTASTPARSDHDHLAQNWTASAGSHGLQVVHSTADGLLGRSSASTGSHYGVRGQSDSSAGTGVGGFATAGSGSTFGVYGTSSSSSGRGVFGAATVADGPARGVSGQTSSTSASSSGVHGLALTTSGNSSGVFGETRSLYGAGVQGISTATAGGVGVVGEGVTAGVYGFSPDGWAGAFDGNVYVTGTLSKGGGSFKIDHPLDPENKYLYHSFVESPDMMNIYNGNVTTDGAGYAVIELPEWFEALNRDPRYQLTVIDEVDGPEFVQAKVVRVVARNSFAIRTSAPHTRVSWLVTGIRQDAFANKHRIPVEEAKPEHERGTYLHPVEHGAPPEKGFDLRRVRARAREKSR